MSTTHTEDERGAATMIQAAARGNRGCPCCVHRPGNYSRAFGRYSHLKKSPDSPVRDGKPRPPAFDYRPRVPDPDYEAAAGGKEDRAAAVDYEEISARLENLRRVQHELMVADQRGLPSDPAFLNVVSMQINHLLESVMKASPTRQDLRGLPSRRF